MNQSTTTTTCGGLRGLLDRLDALQAAGEPALLGLVVATEGSTYQKPGALVLLAPGGMRHGVISGGCLEPELEHRAAAVFASGRALLTEFDTRSDEDLLFGSGSGCRGRVRLLLLPQPREAPLTRALRRCVADAVAVEITVALDGDALGSGSVGAAPVAGAGGHRDYWNASGATAAAADPGATRVTLRIAPPPVLWLLGAGPETPPLLDFGARLGWTTLVAEHRGRWLAFARAARATTILDGGPAAALEQLAARRCDAAIVMSHNYTLDAQYLRFCAHSATDYVGLLGPPARRDALLAELGAAADALRPRLHAPVGLDLGGSGPDVIALAVSAELQRHFARRRNA